MRIMDLKEALLDSWDRQSRIVNAVATRVTESNRKLKPSEDGWPLDMQLAHIHQVRRFWLSNVDPERGALLGRSFTDDWETPIDDLDEIKRLVAQSGTVIREAMEDAFSKPLGQVGFYDNVVLFLQHMVWHDGWHVGLISLGLRLGGEEMPEEWEENHVWGEWRTEEY